MASTRIGYHARRSRVLTTAYLALRYGHRHNWPKGDLTSRNLHWSHEYAVEDDDIIFVHIPRSGGTSFQEFANASDLDLNFVNLGLHRPVSLALPPDDFRYWTILRNPVHRVWSSYRQQLDQPRNHFHSVARAGLQFFCRNHFEARNLAVRMLSGDVWNEPSEKTLYLAMANLDKFERVLDFQNLSVEFQHLRGDAAGAPHHIARPTRELMLNKGWYKHMTNEERDVILGYNDLDYRLWLEWERRWGVSS